MDIQVEPLKKCIVEMDAMLVEDWNAIGTTIGEPPIDMDWDHYIEQEQLQQCVPITAREDEELVGFAMYMVIMHPHHKTVRYALCDSLIVKPAYRNVGIGAKLVTAAEPLLKMYYVKWIVHAFRTAYDVEPLFPRLGFTLVEQSYVKAVK